MTELPHAPPGPARTDAIFDCLRILHRALDRHGIWHSLAFGTMLGAVRGGDLIPWDDDFDLLLRPADLERVMALSGELGREGISFSQVLRPGNQLALDRRGCSTFSSGAISIIREGKKLGDFFLFHLFRDGVLRRYDFAREIYWCPHSSFPAFFVEELRQVTLRGESFPTLLHTERWLEFVYGADWRVPVKSKNTGGQWREGLNVYGHHIEPQLKALIEWCEEKGWDRSQYALQPAWPRDVLGAGPFGPTERTKDNSRSLWWRDLDELIAHF